MFSEGSVLYFTPYYFTKGSSMPKNKYFVVIKDIDGDLIISSLPTSQDYIPKKYDHLDGCINDDSINVCCYKFRAKKIISTCMKYSFPKTTYIHGGNVDILSKSDLKKNYPKVGSNYKKLFVLDTDVLNDLKQCLINSGSVKRKIKKNL